MAKMSILQVLHTVCITSRQFSGHYVADFLMPVRANVTGPTIPIGINRKRNYGGQYAEGFL